MVCKGCKLCTFAWIRTSTECLKCEEKMVTIIKIKLIEPNTKLINCQGMMLLAVERSVLAVLDSEQKLSFAICFGWCDAMMFLDKRDNDCPLGCPFMTKNYDDVPL
uniref:Uncharacterized protein n=1 Tax=Anguilla anguilla TaxID=7936 RepID=A0A0E9RU17_ANGAN